MLARHIIRLALASAILSVASTVPADEPLRFAEQIAPILEQHCLRCHAAGIEKGELSLATINDLKENAYVVPGDPDASHLVQLITAAGDEVPEMPKDADPLSQQQVELIRRWIREGAEWPQDVVLREPSQADASWWSLQPLHDVSIPSPEGIPTSWQASPVDRFVFAKLAEREMSPNPPADRRTLIRRATYDLLGLPPTPEQVEAFAHDPDPQAYEKLIDRLLASPHYGERWGRHWLDVVRFGESRGYERNEIINDAWPFRDYVIRSINDDKPFDQFIREHLAGDVVGAGNPDVEIASAFLVAGPYDDVGNQDAVQAAQIRANTIDEIIVATTQAFLGLTVGCARCHDHKFDPILQQDYYALYATFAGVRHGSRVLATPQQIADHAARLEPLHQQRGALTGEREALIQSIRTRAEQRLADYEQQWTRDKPDRRGTEESFAAVEARFVRLICESQDGNPAAQSFCIDEFEIWTAEDQPRNVALASGGATASGASRQIEDFPGAYGADLAIDGKFGARFISAGNSLTIELPAPATIQRVFFSSARVEAAPDHPQFFFVADYRIEVSQDGQNWQRAADSHNRRPVSDAHRAHRLQSLENTAEDRARLAELDRRLADVNAQIGAVAPLPVAWVGNHVAEDAQGPFHVFLGGSPQRRGDAVLPSSLDVLDPVAPAYRLADDTPAGERRQALADWIVHPANPLTPRVLANRIWHYHFGTGIVDTPSDFGYMGGRPTHPELLDWLAGQLIDRGWRLKPLHKLIMLSQTYQQSSRYRADAGGVDGDVRLVWRFPPRRLSAEEIRDTMLCVSDKLDRSMGGPGFRLYRYLQDNVATYVPLDKHGPETYRRGIYHHNARASRTDLMSDFDQPDCAFSTPRRAETTTPLQALTALNHQFTLDMAGFMAERLQREAGSEPARQVQRAYALCYGRPPSADESAECVRMIEAHGLAAFCRVLMNTSELIYLN